MRVLGIETSCDETGVALYDSEQGLLAEALYSQVELHAEYGGVVPELASRDHIQKLIPLIREVMLKANVDLASIGALAYAWGVPAIGVHHMEGHLLAPMLEETAPEFPFVALLVSGGHTQLVEVAGIGQYELLGESLDDAAGEAFDKAAKMMGMGYPGGPLIAMSAKKGDSNRFTFPRPMVNRPGLDFSFSGLKTHTLNTVADCKEQNNAELSLQDQYDIASAFERAVVDTLVIKCRRALEQTGLKRLIIAGGVSANQQLRLQLEKALKKIGCSVFYARPEYCTDNGAMIAYAGCQRLLAGERSDMGVSVKPRWPLNELATIKVQ